MKRLILPIFTFFLLFTPLLGSKMGSEPVLNAQVQPGETPLLSSAFKGLSGYFKGPKAIKYWNIGPLALFNFIKHCAYAIQCNSNSYPSLETGKSLQENPEKKKSFFNYKNASHGLQRIKWELCNSMQLDPHTVYLKKKLDHHGISSYTNCNTIVVNKEYLQEPRNQQKSVMAHELVHIKYDDCTTQENFDVCARYATTVASFGLGYILHGQPGMLFEAPAAEYASAAYSRTQEFRADEEAAKYAGAAHGLIEYFKARVEDDAEYNLLSSHPTFAERIARLQPYVQQGKTS